MKKFYAIVAAALVSVSLFAAPTKVPTVADLGAKYDVQNNVVLCFYFDVAPCNDVVLAGSYNGWTEDPSKCEVFEELDGFDGWWVAQVKWVEGIQAKPLQLDGDGTFSGWDYQAGDKDAWIRLGDGKEASLSDGYSGEANVAYPEAGAYIYEIAYWKLHHNPCGEIKMHDYKLVLFPPKCEENEEDFVPAVAGGFNGWAFEPLSKGIHEGKIAYIYEVTTSEGKEFKFTDATFGWDNQYQWYNAETESWANFDNQVLGEKEVLVFDYSDGTKYKYPLCGIEIFDVDVKIKVPAGAPETGVELMGNFIGGDNFAKGVQMELIDGKYTASVRGIGINTFKLRETGNWDNQVQIWDEEKEAWVNNDENWQFEENWEEGAVAGRMLIDLDWTDPAAYRWPEAGPQGIQNVTLTEKAHKVVVDGVLYIVRDNKLFNVQGAQIR